MLIANQISVAYDLLAVLECKVSRSEFIIFSQQNRKCLNLIKNAKP